MNIVKSQFCPIVRLKKTDCPSQKNGPHRNQQHRQFTATHRNLTATHINLTAPHCITTSLNNTHQARHNTPQPHRNIIINFTAALLQHTSTSPQQTVTSSATHRNRIATSPQSQRNLLHPHSNCNLCVTLYYDTL